MGQLLEFASGHDGLPLIRERGGSKKVRVRIRHLFLLAGRDTYLESAGNTIHLIVGYM
ncbi:hypothetical protein FHX15_001793 [Rhizobium sp. BK650]|nr:hypothetical protein [Rhizobium sp. BK650]